MDFKNIASPVKKIGFQLGVSLLEVLGSIAVGAVVLVGVADQTNRYIDNTKDAYTAEHARLYAAAARAYVKDNKNDTTKITSDPQVVSDADLQKYLPVGFGAGAKNPYRQSPRVVVRKNGAEVEGYLVYQGGDAIPRGRRQFVSVMAGIGGGFVDSIDTPQGSGWSDSNYQSNFSRVLSATVGRPVVSLNLFDPVDVQDCRYLSVGYKTGCGDKLDRDLDMGTYGINVTSLTNVRKIIAGDNILNISGATSFSHTVNISSSVEIGGAVNVGGVASADALSPGLKVSLGSSCVGYRLGTIARLLTAEPADKGSLLSCQREPSSETPPAPRSWRPLLSAQEERLAIVGCWSGNDYCERTPEATCKDRDGNKGDGVTKCDFDWQNTTNGSTGNDGRGYTQYWWEVEIGERTFCALGFHAQTQSTLPAVTTEGVDKGTTVTGRPDHTFCRVYPKRDVAANNVEKWYLKVGSAYKTPVACHAVCLKGM